VVKISGRHAAGLLFLAGLLASPAGAGLKQYDPVDVTNFALEPENARWLVGPIAHLASEQERAQYLQLSESSAAEEFVAAFWERRGPNLVFPPTGPKITFDRRAEEADKIYTEGTARGRRTDRGTVLILYGAPATIEYGSSPTPRGEPIEIWVYGRKREKGLDGKKPEQRYGFRRHDGLTKFFPLSGVKPLSKTRTRIPRG